jgi:hypothetical protein
MTSRCSATPPSAVRTARPPPAAPARALAPWQPPRAWAPLSRSTACPPVQRPHSNLPSAPPPPPPAAGKLSKEGVVTVLDALVAQGAARCAAAAAAVQPRRCCDAAAAPPRPAPRPPPAAPAPRPPAAGGAEWVDAKAKVSALVLWRSVEQWAEVVAGWARSYGLQDSVMTVEELSSGDDVRHTGARWALRCAGGGAALCCAARCWPGRRLTQTPHAPRRRRAGAARAAHHLARAQGAGGARQGRVSGARAWRARLHAPLAACSAGCMQCARCCRHTI